MMHRSRCALALAAWLWGSSFALGQQGPAPSPGAPPASRELEPAVDTSAAPPTPVASGPSPSAGKESAAKAGKTPAQDRIDLDATQITGNRELPKVLYIVPWKRPDPGDFVGRPPNSLVDEILAPVDRDVFQRENRYYDALKPDATAATGNAGRETETARPAAAGSQNPP